MTIEAAINFLDDGPHASSLIEEAGFGRRHLAHYVGRLGEGSRVLEVGAGTGILLSELSAAFPHISFVGIEPMRYGFEAFDDYLEHEAVTRDFDLHRVTFEGFEGAGPFDLIYLVNVFEHLADWREFLRFAKARLAPDGVCVVLCPNYGFPYESHFRVPILFNKAITYAVFNRRIRDLEPSLILPQVWESLNFVRFAQVRAFVRTIGLEVHFDTDIVRAMFDRFDSDAEFADRQKILRGPARVLKRSGALDWALRSKLCLPFLPYMHLEMAHAR